MWEFIVMGQIPGTHFQITFTTWLALIITPAVIWMAAKSTLSVGKKTRSLRRSRFLAALHISYVLQTTAYIQLLATRRHIQA